MEFANNIYIHTHIPTTGHECCQEEKTVWEAMEIEGAVS
jgi:hypothetical protein